MNCEIDSEDDSSISIDSNNNAHISEDVKNLLIKNFPRYNPNDTNLEVIWKKYLKVFDGKYKSIDNLIKVLQMSDEDKMNYRFSAIPDTTVFHKLGKMDFNEFSDNQKISLLRIWVNLKQV